jgi:ribosomal protein S18 acetylase RimI-like enzyme
VLCYDEAGPEMFRVHVVGVRQPWRRRGVATALLAEMLNAGREAGRTTARLEVNADDPTGALGVCERAGFTVSSQSTTYSVLLHNN